jgi:hypothetical protein
MASLMANFLPFVIFQVKRFIENEFGSDVPIYDPKTKKIEYVQIDDLQMQFTDDVIKEKIENFIHGYSNRLAPFTVKVNGKDRMAKFKGRFTNEEDVKYGIDTGVNIDPNSSITTGELDRVITWCDIFFICTTEATKDKCVLITRYPIDSFYNQFPSFIVVSSTKETEPIYYNGEYYKYYPKIRSEDIGANTSNKFVDTLRMSNLMLGAIGGDYDGDQVSVKGVFTKEANEECARYINSKANIIGMDGKSVRGSSHESVQAIYSLTITIPEDRSKLKDPEF